MIDNSTVGKAVIFIENNLYEPITASDVAHAVSYSYYYFHRYFHMAMGETIGNYIRTRRLTQAAQDLIHTQKKIVDIGISLYFETAEGFTRAFKERYWITPTEYRKNGTDALIGNRPSAQISKNIVYSYANLIPQIVTVPEIELMGIRFYTNIDTNKSTAMWEHLNQQIPYTLMNNTRYGIFESSKNCSPEQFSSQSETTAFIGIEISEEQSILRGMQRKKLYGGKYARVTHRGTVENLIQTYYYIWGIWFPKSGYQLDERDDFECYTKRFLGADTESSEIDIYFAIK